ncbi:aminopeptidase P family protein [Paracoccus sp. p3-h83]|uniref:aminopeptidase P family protein n=1 Tax=Paracoccus sp. p3-h83 TaxID=3342805 RepID=UPI0035BA328E
MLQDFTLSARPENGPPRLAALRGQMAQAGLDGWLQPRADAHQGEYVAACDDRLAWLTGFTGSAGGAYVTRDRAAVASDGRYRLQARDQCAPEIEVLIEPGDKPADWLRAALPQGGRLGFDPWLHTPAQIAGLEKALAGSGIELVAHDNLVARIWADRPAAPAAPARLHPGQWAGEAAADKRARMAAALKRDGQRAVVLTLPDSIAWLTNLRGADIPRNPVMQAFAILTDEAQLTIFTEPSKLAGLDLDAATRIRPQAALAPALRMLTGPVRLDPATAPLAVRQELDDAGVSVSEGADPVILAKAVKNRAEIAGMQAAHHRDALAMVRFLAWLDAAISAGQPLTEIAVVRQLEAFRADTGELIDLSFETICGSGPHGAIVHYRVTEDSDRAIRPGDVLLIDSGAQYADGTTDITRTLPVGDAGDPAFDAVRGPYTRVLQGMIAISRLRFPTGLAGRDIDAVARAPLWMAGQDYDHGTGHGVGAALSVHEGPARISRMSDVALQAGMILSNEPGYYRAGAFGIRIENLIVVAEAEAELGRAMLGFDTLTLVPIDTRLIDRSLMARAEIDWLNAYHARVRDALSPHLTGDDLRWLTQATEAL